MSFYTLMPANTIVSHGPRKRLLFGHGLQQTNHRGFSEAYLSGTPKTFLWFIEEIGELATALNGDDRANLEEEFADALAWLCTLANINEIDLAAAVSRKYLGKKRPKGHK